MGRPLHAPLTAISIPRQNSSRLLAAGQLTTGDIFGLIEKGYLVYIIVDQKTVKIRYHTPSIHILYDVPGTYFVMYDMMRVQLVQQQVGPATRSYV